MKQNLLTRSILTLVMLVMSVSVWADDKVFFDGIPYTLDKSNHTAEVARDEKNRKLEGHLEIPAKIMDGGIEYTVTSIARDALFNAQLESVILPNTITTIKSGAFQNCFCLASIDLGGSVKSIELAAFKDCLHLSSVTNYESVEYVGYTAFYCVPWISNHPDGVVYIGKALYIYNGAMPDNTSITIKDGTLQICEDAFRKCKNLVAVTIPNSVKRVEQYAFYHCSKLSSISIPESVKFIGRSAFDDTQWLADKPNDLVYINNILYTYNGNMPKGTSVTIQDGTTAIGPYALWGKSDMVSVTIPNTVKTIYPGAFSDCTGLTSIEIPSSVTSIGDDAFHDCGFKSITIPHSIDSIPRSAFDMCKNLETVNLPSSIKYIGQGAFYWCPNLKEFTCLSETIPTTEYWNIFYLSNLDAATLYVRQSALEAYKNSEAWNEFGTIMAVEELSDDLAPTIEDKNIRVKNVTFSSVELSWVKASDNYTPQNELIYSVYVNGTLDFQFRNLTGYIVPNLKPSTTYTFEIRVEDLRGNVSKYKTVQATTNPKPVVIEKYPVLIEYKQITSENADDFWGDGGSIKYDPATKTLTLAWADLYSDDDAICIYDDITIKLIGQNTVKGSIYADYTGELTFAGEGSINVKGSYPLYGWLSALVLKDGCTVELDATGYDSPGLGLDDCLLGVDHSTLKVKGGKGNRSIRAVTTFWMEGSEFESNHSYDKVNYMFLDATGKEATDEIIIAPIIKKIPQITDNTITVVSVDDTSATVAWQAATDDTTPQSELTYSIYSMKYGSSDFTGDAHQKGMTSYTYTNLQPGTTYYVSVKVVDKDGNQVFYQDASFTTTTPDTSAPALSDDEIRATKVTDKSISLEWTKASDDRTAEDQLVYEVVYADNSSFADNYLMVQMDKNTATLKNLTPSTTYYIKVSVSDEASNRSEYRVLSVKTVSSATAISTIAADDNSNSIMYNTTGIRVDKSFRGIVIKDGKKFFNK